jgi:hypothetical protein
LWEITGRRLQEMIIYYEDQYLSKQGFRKTIKFPKGDGITLTQSIKNGEILEKIMKEKPNILKMKTIWAEEQEKNNKTNKLVITRGDVTNSEVSKDILLRAKAQELSRQNKRSTSTSTSKSKSKRDSWEE